MNFTLPGVSTCKLSKIEVPTTERKNSDGDICNEPVYADVNRRNARRNLKDHNNTAYHMRTRLYDDKVLNNIIAREKQKLRTLQRTAQEVEFKAQLTDERCAPAEAFTVQQIVDANRKNNAMKKRRKHKNRARTEAAIDTVTFARRCVDLVEMSKYPGKFPHFAQALERLFRDRIFVEEQEGDLLTLIDSHMRDLEPFRNVHLKDSKKEVTLCRVFESMESTLQDVRAVLSEWFDVIKRAVEEAGKVIPHIFTIAFEIAVDVFVAIYASRRIGNSTEGRLILLYQVCRIMGVSIRDATACVGIYHLVTRLYGYLTASGVSKPSVESDWRPSSIIDMIGDLVRSVTGSNILVTIRDLIVSIASLRFFSYDVASVIFKFLGKASYTSVSDMILGVLDSLAKLMRVGEAIYDGVPISEVLFSPDPVKAALSEARQLLTYSELLYSGLPVPGKLSEREFIVRSRAVLPILEKVSTRISPFSSNARSHAEVLANLTLKVTELESKQRGHHRRCPIGVIIHSPPGVGKSTWVNYVARIMSDVMERDYDPSHIYSRVTSSDYWEGYDGWTHPFVHYSELGDTHKNLVRVSGDNVTKELTSVLDVLPMCLNMAFTGKSKTFFFSDMVIIDTNNQSLNLDELFNNPSAFRRRFIYLDVSVKPEFRKEVGCGIDPAKTAGVRLMEPFTVSISQMDQINNKQSKKVMRLTDGDCDQAYDVLFGLFKHHIQVQSDFQEKMRGDSKVAYGRLSELRSCFADSDIPICDRGMVYDDDLKCMEDISVAPIILSRDKIPCVESKEILDLDNPYASEEQLMEREEAHVNSVVRKLKSSVNDTYARVLGSVSDLSRRVSVRTARWRRGWQTYFGGLRFVIGENVVPIISDAFELAKLECFGAAAVSALDEYWRLFIMSCVYTWMMALLLLNLGDILSVRSVVTFIGMAIIFTNIQRISVVSPARSRLITRRLELRQSIWEKWLRTSNFFYSNADYSLAIVGAWVGVLYVVKWVSQSKRTIDAAFESTQWRLTSSANVGLNAHEVSLACDRSTREIKTSLPGVWNVRQVVSDITFTSGPEDLELFLGNSLYRVEVFRGRGSLCTCILGVAERYAIINEHALPKAPSCMMKIFSGKGEKTAAKEAYIDLQRRIRISEDVSLIEVHKLCFRNIVNHFTDMPISVSSGVVAGTKVSITSVSEPLTIDSPDGPIEVGRHFVYNLPGHKVGICGTPVCASFGSKSAIVGIHAAGYPGLPTAIGVEVTRKSLLAAIQSMREKSAFMVTQSMVMPQLGDPHLRSPFRFYDLHYLEYFGSDGKQQCVKSKTRLYRNSFAASYHEVLSSYGYSKTKEFGPALLGYDKLSGVNPYAVNLLKMNKSKLALSTPILERCIRTYSDHIIRGLEAKGVTSLHPLIMEEAINGAIANPSIRRINASTGSGYGLPGKKSTHLPIVVDDHFVIREPTDNVKHRVLAKLEQYRSGECAGSIFGAKLKDEPRTVDKVIAGKTRMFFPSPLDLLIVSRMVLSPFFNAMVQHGEVFRSSVGIDMWSGAHEFYSDILEFARDRCASEICGFEGDYGGYDTSMPEEIGLAAGSVIASVLRHFGYNDSALAVVHGVLTENIFPFVEVNGDVMRVPGLMTSGSYGTAEFNCIRNVLLMLYYFEAHPNLTSEKFFTDTLISTYGDDVVGVVGDTVSEWFNCKNYAKFCDTCFGMDFTGSDKKPVSVPFISVRDISFLKRSFGFNDGFSRYVAKLDDNSLFRMIEWLMKSDSISEADQVSSILTSMAFEVGMSLDEFCYASFVENIEAIYRRQFRANITLPSYSRVVQTICPNLVPGRGEDQADGIAADYIGHGVSDDLAVECEANALEEGIGSPSGCALNTAHLPANKIHDNILELETEVSYIEQKESDLLKQFDHLEPRVLLNSPQYLADDSYRQLVDRYVSVYTRLSSLRATLAIYQRELAKRRLGGRPVAESGPGQMDDGNITSLHSQQNVDDTAGTKLDEAKVGTSTYDVAGDDLALKGFFERPVQIAALKLGLDANIDLVLNVWDLYLKDPTVRAKLRNYAFMRCDLNVKFAVSGTPFHYGRLLVAYEPYIDVNTVFPAFGPTYRVPRLKYLSQAPGARTIDVKDNNPLIMHIPYVAPQPVGRLFNSSGLVITDSESFNDFSELGSVFISTLNPIKAVNTTASEVYLYVYAYASNVKLHGATGTHLQVTTEARLKRTRPDERVIGPVERISSSLAAMSDKAALIPEIGPYAMASSMVLNAVSGVASLFGWSYPTLIAEPERMRPDPWQNGAHTIGVDTGKRITLDPKQELTIDPRVAGVDYDELSISSICARESLLDTFEWSEDSLPTSDVIWRAIVAPRSNYVDLVRGQLAVQPTALSFANTPFQYWRGDITYRFDIVASNFHRGKLMFVYEPNVSQFDLITLSTRLNKQYVRIIDIQDTQSVEFTVEWNHSRPWCRSLPDDKMAFTIGAQCSPSADFADTCNGVFYVIPFTALQSPDSSSLQINVFVKSDNMMFNRLTAQYMPKDRNPYNPRPTIEAEEKQEDVDISLPVSQLAISSAVMDEKVAPMDCFGELPVSFRTLLKRFAQNRILDFGASSNEYKIYTLKSIPADQYASTDLRSKPSLYNYLRWAFLGQRGALRRRLRTNQWLNGSVASGTYGVPDMRVLVSLLPDSTTELPYDVTLGSDNMASIALDGTVQFISTVNAGVEVEIPFYTNNLFLWSCNDDPWYNSSAMDPIGMKNYQVIVEAPFPSRGFLSEMIASGEDFTFLRWLGAYPYALNSSS